MKNVTTSGQTPRSEPQQLDEHENKILDRAEKFYTNRINHILLVMSIIITVAFVTVGIIVPILLELQREKSFEREMAARLANSEGVLKKYAEKQTEELEAKLRKEMYPPLSASFLVLADSYLSKKPSPAAYKMGLICNILAMKFDIMGQGRGTYIPPSKIKSLFYS